MLHDEQVLTFSQAAKTLPHLNGKRPHTSTLWRWARKGIGGVFLETRRLGGRFVTSAEAIERFSKALAEIPLEPHDAPRLTRTATDTQRTRSIERAEHTLEGAGIL